MSIGSHPDCARHAATGGAGRTHALQSMEIGATSNPAPSAMGDGVNVLRGRTEGATGDAPRDAPALRCIDGFGKP